jgi:predicted PurR-regulated permease PerM
VHRRIEARVKRANLAATISVLIVALIVVAPATFVAERLIGEAAMGAEVVRARVESGEWRKVLEAHPSLAPLGVWVEQQWDLPGTARSVAGWLTNTGASLVRGSVVQLVALLLTFYLLFYFLRDRQEALGAMRALTPLSGEEMDRMFQRVADTVHATIYGTVAVAAVQGALGGLMFWWLGLPAPLLWGLVMGLLAVVPVLGAFVVWIPAALYLALEGAWAKALILTLWGGVVVAGIDNVLYPILVGNRLKMHTVLAFISVVGGLIVFGAPGLILGPVALTITVLLLEVWRSRSGPPGADARDPRTRE